MRRGEVSFFPPVLNGLKGQLGSVVSYWKGVTPLSLLVKFIPCSELY